MKQEHRGKAFAFRSGFTLVEMAVVVAILAVVAVVAVSRTGEFARRAKTVAAEADMAALREAFTAEGTGLLADMQGIPGFSPADLRIANLLAATNLYAVAWQAGTETFGTAVRIDDPSQNPAGVAPREEFLTWSEERGRGWRGPYVRHATRPFPGAGDRRFPGDDTFEERRFFPDASHLYLADDFKRGIGGRSVYGIPGEGGVFDPWGNPYVLQVPPPQAFDGDVRRVAPEARFRYARLVSAGENGILETPCHYANTNAQMSAWTAEQKLLVRQAGLANREDRSARGDDMVLFLLRNDIDEEGAE